MLLNKPGLFCSLSSPFKCGSFNLKGSQETEVPSRHSPRDTVPGFSQQANAKSDAGLLGMVGAKGSAPLARTKSKGGPGMALLSHLMNIPPPQPKDGVKRGGLGRDLQQAAYERQAGGKCALSKQAALYASHLPLRRKPQRTGEVVINV